MTIAAYAFCAPSMNSSDDPTFCQGKERGYYLTFKTGWDCRQALSCLSAVIQVIVTEDVADVAPLNLVAALHHDDPQRDIYVLVQEATAALSSRVRAAGGRGIVDHAQKEALLGFEVSSDEPACATDNLVMAASAEYPLEDCLYEDEPQKTIILKESAHELTAQVVQEASAQTTNNQTQATLVPAPPVQAPPIQAASVQMPPAPPVLSSQVLPSSPQTFAQAQGLSLATDAHGCMIAFVSGRGGVGKSTLSLLTAILLQQRGQKVVLLDLDLQFGDLSYFVGETAKQFIQQISLDAVLNGPEQPQPTAERLCLIEAPTRPEYAEEYTEEISCLIRALKTDADYVIVNTGSFWSELQAILAQNADHLMFVMDQRATSVRGCKQAVDLCVRLQIPSARFGFLLNRCARNAPLSALDVSMALGGGEVLSIADGGPIVDEMLALGCPHELLESETALRDSFEPLLGSLKIACLPSQYRVTPTLGAFASIIRGLKRGGHVSS